MLNLNIPDTIKYVNRVYKTSLSLAELEGGINELKDLLATRSPNQENKVNALGLLYRITAKYLAIKYFDGGYTSEDFEILGKEITSAVAEINKDESLYKKTKLLLENLLITADAINNIVCLIPTEISKIQDDAGNYIFDDVEKIEYVINFLKNKKERISVEVADTATLFPTDVTMFDVKARVLADIDNILSQLEKELADKNNKDVEQFFNNNVKDLDAKNTFPLTLYSESLITGAKNSCKAYVIFSPLEDEVTLFIKAFALNTGNKTVRIEAFAFEGKDDAFIDKFFVSAKSQALSLLIVGLKGYTGANREHLIKNLLIYSKNGYFVFMPDGAGERAFYEELSEMAKALPETSILDIAFHYLKMPSFSSVTTVLKQEGMITDSDLNFVKANLLYMGYVGLNKCIYLNRLGKDWKSDASFISSKHSASVAGYLHNIPSQEQFIYKDWIDLQLEEKNTLARADFDYDVLRKANPNNIKKIIQSDFNMFAKCGLIARYCTLCGDDYSIWKDLPIEEREQRLTDATTLVAYLLQCQYAPEVEIVPNAKWASQNAGGYCKNGGKQIVYKDSASKDYDWVVKAVCHECYHSFQFTLENNGFKKWHRTELLVTEPRIKEWSENTRNYVDIDDNEEAYMRQVLEADARIFEQDCFNESLNKWQLLNLE